MMKQASAMPIPPPIALGLKGARENLLPGIFLWIVGGILVVVYFTLPPATAVLDSLGAFKQRHNIWFAPVSTAFFGGLIPWIAQSILLPIHLRTPTRQLPWLMAFWAISGSFVNVFYSLQAQWFGDSADVLTIVKKTSVDQLLYTPIIAVPLMTLGYLLIEKTGSLYEVRAALQRKSFFHRTIPVLIANWAVWIPAISLIYLFPLSLQLPLVNIVLCFWCLILAFISKNNED